MNRRKFIKLCGVAVSALFFCPKFLFAKKQYSDFHPRMYCGEWAEVITDTGPGRFNKKQEAEVRYLMEQRIRARVPKKYQEFTEIIIKFCGNSGTEDCRNLLSTAGWKYVPKKPFYPGYNISHCRFKDGRPDSFALRKGNGKFQAISEQTYLHIAKMTGFTFKRELGKVRL